MRKFFDQKAGYVFLLPWMIGLFGFTAIPMLTSLYYSFTNYQLSGTIKFVGLDNFIRMFVSDYHFINAVRVTCTYVFIAVPIQIIVALILAMVLNKGLPGLSLLRTMFYIPSLLGASVAIAILWMQLFNSDGLINMGLRSLGFTQLAKTSWIADPRYNLGTLILLRIWQFGSPMVIFLAGLKQIPSELYEAASIDGAKTIHSIFYITLPLLSPIIQFNTVMQLIGAFKAFTEALIIGGASTMGGIRDSLLFITVHLYRAGFQQYAMGYASALAWILLLIVALFTVLIFKLSDSRIHYN
jgi:multiple sugar transport system permease protein